jgi:hypothetical protein
MDSEIPIAGGASVVQCSKSNPVTPQVAKKIELPPRAPPTVVPPASAFSAVAAAPPLHNGAFSRVFGSVIHNFHLMNSWKMKSKL